MNIEKIAKLILDSFLLGWFVYQYWQIVLVLGIFLLSIIGIGYAQSPEVRRIKWRTVFTKFVMPSLRWLMLIIALVFSRIFKFNVSNISQVLDYIGPDENLRTFLFGLFALFIGIFFALYFILLKSRMIKRIKLLLIY